MFENWESDSKVTEFLRWKTAVDISEARSVLSDWIRGYENLDFYQWAIVLKEIGDPIGTISVVGKNELLDIVHIGYCIGGIKVLPRRRFLRLYLFSLKRLG